MLQLHTQTVHIQNPQVPLHPIPTAYSIYIHPIQAPLLTHEDPQHTHTGYHSSATCGSAQYHGTIHLRYKSLTERNKKKREKLKKPRQARPTSPHDIRQKPAPARAPTPQATSPLACANRAHQLRVSPPPAAPACAPARRPCAPARSHAAPSCSCQPSTPRSEPSGAKPPRLTQHPAARKARGGR